MVNNTLKITNLKTDSLIPYAMNSRIHSDSQVSQIAASIKEFGFLNPVIVDGKNGIIAGHGRVMAAKKLGLAEVPAIEASHLTDAQRKAYIIADNKLALNAGWDEEILKIELQDLQELKFDLNLLGFDSVELKNMFQTPDFAPGTEEDQGRLDELEPKYVDCPNCGKEFDLRQYG